MAELGKPHSYKIALAAIKGTIEGERLQVSSSVAEYGHIVREDTLRQVRAANSILLQC